MPNIKLNFIAPGDEDIAKLYVLESTSALGPFIEIDSTTQVGSAPDYIDYFETGAALSLEDWFTIQWETVGGVKLPMSTPIKGGSATLVGELVERVLQRDHSLNRNVVQQEAESAIQMYYSDNTDPYDTTLNPSYRIKNGLTYLIMARALIAGSIKSAEVQSATMGLVSFKASTSTNTQRDVDALVALANKELGLSMSYIMLIEDVEQATYLTADFSRLVSGYLSIDV